jgi:hypothetical protein
MARKPRYVVYEQEQVNWGGAVMSRVNDVFGVFTSWDKANKLCKKLQKEHPANFYGIRELLTGNLWLR